jgi:hypothetical protein
MLIILLFGYLYILFREKMKKTLNGRATQASYRVSLSFLSLIVGPT